MIHSSLFGVLLLLFLRPDQSFAFAAPKNFVVTGASGYLGREIVNTIISQHGDDAVKEIVCLVRENRVDEESEYWSSKNCVKVMPYDMLDGGSSVEKALNHVFSSDENENNNNNDSCCVFHVASIFTPTEEHEKMALDNVKGTKDMINAVAKFPTDRIRVIFTSSMAAVRAPGQPPQNGKYYTHLDWNTQSQLGENWGASYQWSKAESEKRGWDLAKEMGIQFTSLNPAFIFGPPSSKNPTSSASFSITTVSKWLSGEGPVQSRLCVDVRDVAKAHVVAAMKEQTIGERIIIARESRIPSETIADELKKMAIELNIGKPDKIYPDTSFSGGAITIGEKEVGCFQRMEDLLDGFKVRPVQETMRDMAKALLQMER